MKIFYRLKNNFNKLTTITIFNEKIVIFAYQLQIFFEKNVNFKLISINARQTIQRVTSSHSRSSKFKQIDVNDNIEQIKFIDFLESKHVFCWVMNHSRFRRNVRIFVHIVKIVLKNVVSSFDVSLSQKFTTKISKMKTFIRRFNSISRITIEKNIYNQLFEFHFDENNIINQLNAQTQRIVDVVIDNYIVKHFSQFDSSKLSNFSNLSKSQSIVENNDDNDISIWRSKNLDFFDSHLSLFYEFEFIIRNNKNVYYRNVHFFVEKILNLIVIKKHDLMKTNLNICFYDNVFIWYIVKFTILKRFDLRQINLTKNWINSLKKSFKFN